MLGIDSRAARVTWTVFLVLLAIELAWLARTTLLVFTIALLVSYLLAPVVRLVARWLPPRAPAWVAPALVYAAGVGVVVMGGLVIGTRIAAEAASLASQFPAFLTQRDQMLERYLPSVLAPYREDISEALSTQLATGQEHLVPALTAMGRGLMHQVSSALYVVLIPILSFLMQLSLRDARWMAKEFFEDAAHQELTDTILGDVDLLLGLYVRAIFLLALATFVSHCLVLGVLGVPYAVLLAGICGLLEFIPVVGPLAGMVIATSVAVFSGYDHAGWLVAFFLLYRLFQDYVLQPYLYSSGIEMHPLLVLFGVLAGEQIGGVTGMFLSVPAMALMRIVYRRAFTRRVAAPL